MGAVTLTELFYQNREAYERFYQARIESPHTVRLDFEVNGNQAFFERTPEINDALAAILRSNSEIERLCAALPKAALEQFARRCLIDEIVLSNDIEGVRSTRKEIDDLLNEAESQNRRKRFYGLVQKYRMLMTKEDIPLNSCQDIRAIYDELVLPEVQSEEPENFPDGQLFRKSSVSVYSPSQKEIHRGAYPEGKIMELMEKALRFLHSDSCDILYRIAVFHYLLEYIHPFYDGNGRLGRFICSYLLSRELVPVTGYRISYTIQERVKEYYHAFSVCNDYRNRGDLTPFVMMFMNVIQVSVEKLKESLREGRVQLERCGEKIPLLPGGNEPKTGELYFLLIQAALFSEYGVSTSEIMAHLHISYSTFNRMLTRIPSELLLKTKRKRMRYYHLDLKRMEDF